MTPDNFEGVEEPRKTWCIARMARARAWVKSYGRDTLEVQLEAALERMVGIESLLNEKALSSEFTMSVTEFVKLWEDANMRKKPWFPICTAPKNGLIFVIGESSGGQKDAVALARWQDTSREEDILVSQKANQKTYETKLIEDGYWDTVRPDRECVFPDSWMHIPDICTTEQKDE